ncbi:unnamed protein product [Allacma fusca]|uniref:Uncharacterized protein n=1 Tax=Allacma fusca TaxID=39272 RepID=A0A8J2LI30_9HEXA|nr:unnamed protein product [Allacma fusca]
MPKKIKLRFGSFNVPVKHVNSKSKTVRNAPEADNLMTVKEKKLLQVQFAYEHVCSFCNFRGHNFTEVATHVASKCELPLTNVMVFNLLEDQPKGTCKKPSAVELGASGVSNRSLSRLFAQVFGLTTERTSGDI